MPTAPFALILAGICAALHIWKLPPALPGLQAEFGLSLLQSGFLLSIVQVGGMVLGLAIGLVAERTGLRRAVLGGLALLALSSALASAMPSSMAILLTRALEGCGFLLVVMPIPALLRRLVAADRLSRVMGLWGSYMPAGTVLILLAGSWFLGISTWQWLWLALAALTAAMLALVFLAVPPDARTAPAADDPRPAPWDMVRSTLGSGKVWAIALTFGVYAAQWAAVIGFLPVIYASQGVSPTHAGMLTAVVAGANIVGNVSAGRLLHGGAPAVRLLLAGFIVMLACAFAAFGSGLPPSWQFAAITVFSMGGGLIPATLFVLALQFAPTRHTTSTTVGWMQQCSSLGQFCGPPAVAWVVNATGGWQWTWLATGTFALLGIGIALRIGRFFPQESDHGVPKGH